MNRNASPPLPVMPWQEGLWWLLTIATFLGWVNFFARRYTRELSLSERLLGSFTATICQIVLITLILGTAHLIYWWPLGIANALVASLIWLWGSRSREGHSLIREGSLWLNSIWALLKTSRALWLFAILASFLIVWFTYLGQLLPPSEFDSWWYHLPWAAYAHQEGHLGPFHQPVIFINIYPMNADIFSLWWIVGAGTERWANIIQIPFSIATALAIYLLAKHAGARPADAASVGLLVFSVPAFLHQLNKPTVDVAVTASTLVTFAFLSRSRLSALALTIAGAMAGFLLGSKGTSVYYFLSLVLYLFYQLSFGPNRATKAPLKNALLAFALFIVTAFLLGSYFYIRNWVIYGNPLGEYEVKIGPIELFEGKMSVGRHNFVRGESCPTVLYDAVMKNEWAVVLDGFFDP